MKQQKSLHKVLTENIGFVFVLPWLIGFLLFKVYPFASSLYYSIINKCVEICNSSLLKSFLILCIKDFLEDILEGVVIFL